LTYIRTGLANGFDTHALKI